MRNFELEVFFSQWEFAAKHHMTASDIESMSLSSLLAMGGDKAREQFNDLSLGYTETWGNPTLREHIAATYEHLQTENILCMAGAGEGIYTTARVLLSAEDHVIVPTPNYQSAETIPLDICAVSGVPMHYDSDNGWSLNIDDIKAATQANTKMISLNFPHNPTGFVLSDDDLKILVDWCREKDIYLFCDEVYRGVELADDNQLIQIADAYEKGISLNVMSKAYGFPGLRVGWLASQDTAFLQKVERYKHYLSICNAAPAEFLATLALQNREAILAANKALLKENVVQLEQLFADFSHLFEWHRPKGGCVAFPKYLGEEGGEVFCQNLLQDSGILLLPSSIYHSELTSVPTNHFRIGFGRRQVFADGLAALRTHLEKGQ